MTTSKAKSQENKEKISTRVMSDEVDRNQVLKTLMDELHAYEMKYLMRAEIFFKLFEGTPILNQPDFLEWAKCYRKYFQVFLEPLRLEK